MPRNSAGEALRLHIGGEASLPGWKILNVKDGADYKQDAKNLSTFGDETVDEIYASHILEHFHYGLDRELEQVLAEWHRVLKPGGRLMVSVPDIAKLCKLYGQRTDPRERFHIMRVLYGGHCNEYDVHKAGFDFEILESYLGHAGFSRITRIISFGLFNDCSEIELWGERISLNVRATKP